MGARRIEFADVVEANPSHGGTFATGTASQYLTPSLVTYGAKTERPFVFVAFNYRLGIFGFLGQEDSSNLGLWDQRLALEWVREHVGAFGGDWRKVSVACSTKVLRRASLAS